MASQAQKRMHQLLERRGWCLSGAGAAAESAGHKASRTGPVAMAELAKLTPAPASPTPAKTAEPLPQLQAITAPKKKSRFCSSFRRRFQS